MKYLPILSIVLNIGYIISYLFCEDYVRSIYWASAATLTTCTLFMK